MGQRPRLSPPMAVLVTLAVVIGLLPFASRYGKTNGLSQRGARWAQGAATRNQPAVSPSPAPQQETSFSPDAVATGAATDLVELDVDLLAEAPLQNGWFPTHFDPASDSFTYGDHTDLAQQLQFAQTLLQAGVPAPTFTAHVKALFARDGGLHAEYTESGDPVSGESSAVYRLAIDYALQTGDEAWATALRDRLLERGLPGR